MLCYHMLSKFWHQNWFFKIGQQIVIKREVRICRGFFFSTVCSKTFHCYQLKKGFLSGLAGTNVQIPSGFPSLLTSFSDVITGCVCPRARPTLASAAKATRASTVTDGRSHLPAGGSAADTGSVACQRAASPCVTVSQGTPDPPVTKVSLDAVTVCQTSTILRPCLTVFFKLYFLFLLRVSSITIGNRRKKMLMHLGFFRFIIQLPAIIKTSQCTSMQILWKPA